MKRWWGIRHVRYMFLVWRFAIWWKQANRFWLTPNPSDLAYLDAVWEGRA